MAHSAYSQRRLKPFLEPRGPLYPCPVKKPFLEVPKPYLYSTDVDADCPLSGTTLC